jgi:peroxiredoxin
MRVVDPAKESAGSANFGRTAVMVFREILGLSRITKVLMVLAILFVLLSCQDKTQAPIEGNNAPSFKLKDLSGSSVSLSDFDGKVVMLEFWATWCTPCKASAPELEALYQRYKDRDFVLLGISLDRGDATDRVGAFMDVYGLHFPVLLDGDKKVAKIYRIAGIPSLFLLDRKHKIVARHTGELDPAVKAELVRKIEDLL